MKILAATLLLLGATLPVRAATQVTVAQLEKTVTAGRYMPDDKLADALSGLELTQRLSPSTLSGLKSGLPGPKSRQELSILAAQSSFLDLPPAEVLPTPAPNISEQRKMMGLVVNYVGQTTRQLPNFLATRETLSFEDRPAGIYAYLPLHQTNQFAVSVLYRDGKEVDKSADGKKAATPKGLVSWGEFGPILTTVLLDAAKSQLAWSHWEHGTAGPVAVFRYSVPGKTSQYLVQMCGQVPDCVRALTGYHGEIAADPSSGAILRLTVIADIEPGSNLEHSTGLTSSAIMVEYGPVDIGGKSYNCPVHSVALAQVRDTQPQHGVIAAEGMDHSPTRTMVNAVSFSNYHIFRGESRIVTDAEVAQATGETDDRASASAPPTPTESQPSSAAEAAPAEPAAASPAVAEAKPTAPASTTQPTTVEPTPTQPSRNDSAASNSALSSASGDIPNTPVYRTTTRQVLVDVIVSKHNGEPVAGLPQSDFSVAEDGRSETIDFFEEHSANAPAPATPPVMPTMPAGAVTNVPTAPASAALYVFLLDSLNTEPQDQVFVRQQVLSFLHRMDPGTQVAVFTLGSSLRMLQGFTSDPATLLAAVSSKMADRDAMAQNRSDNADDAAHAAKLQAMRASGAKIAALQAAEASAHAFGFGARASMTFEALNGLARYLEGIPGRKNLIWFASTFPVVFFPTPSEMDKLKNNPNLPGYVNHVKQTAGLFTISKIAVYPVSGSGVSNSNIGMADSADAGSAGGTGHAGAFANPTSSLSGEALNAGSSHGSMEQLAASTGGHAFTTNDIDAALHSIVRDSSIYYTVGYAPSNSAADDNFRRIEVKVTGGRFKLAYRQGYNASGSGSGPDQNPISPLLQFGIPDATGILYGARVATVPAAPAQSEPAGQNPEVKGPMSRYSVSFTIRAQDIEFDEAPNGKRIARLLVGAKAYGKDGSALNWQATREAIELDDAHYQAALKSGIPITLDLDVPTNANCQLVTAVYDWNTTRSGRVEVSVRP